MVPIEVESLAQRDGGNLSQRGTGIIDQATHLMLGSHECRLVPRTAEYHTSVFTNLFYGIANS